jgi:hypothetical protein
MAQSLDVEFSLADAWSSHADKHLQQYPSQHININNNSSNDEAVVWRRTKL